MKMKRNMYKPLIAIALAFFLCLQAFPSFPESVNASSIKTIVVAKDGSGQFNSIQAAVNSISKSNNTRIVIYIKNGTYKEKVRVSQNLVAFKGESKNKVLLTYDDHVDTSKSSDYNNQTPTVIVTGNDFYAENLTFENTAGQIERANAVKLQCDRSSFFNCRILGGQDTLYLYKTGARSYFQDCYINGDCDFIYGAMVAVFKNCEINSVDGGYVTAASTPQNQKYGFMFDGCKFTGSAKSNTVYLGRPWREYASVLVKNSSLGGHIRAVGWHNWNKPASEKTARYMEYNNSGSGWQPSKRVKWSKILSASEVSSYTSDNYLKGSDNWNYTAKVNVSTSTTTPTPSPSNQTTTPSPTPSSQTSSGNSLKVSYTINNWGSGYQANFKISNPTSKDVNGWTLKVKKSDITISNSWNVTITEDSTYYIIKPVEWNTTISKNGSVEFGVQGTAHINSTISCEIK